MPNAVRKNWLSWLESFDVNERDYVETTLASYTSDRSSAMGPRGTNRPKSLRGRKFSVSLLTAIGANPADIRYLLCVERTK